MADIEYTADSEQQYIDDPGEVSSFGRTVNVLGALASLALIAGICFWGYKLIMRDVSGVPVVQALEGPMRSQPADPGGLPADHQGLAVNNVAAVGTAAPPADRLMLAPRPVQLTDEDVPMKTATATVSAAPAPDAENPKPADAATAAELQNDAVKDLVDQLLRNAGEIEAADRADNAVVTEASARITHPEPLDTGVKTSAPEAVAEPETEAAPEPAVYRGPGLARSIRPQLRPVRVSQPAATTAAGDPAAATPEVDGDTLPAGTRLAQLGAYDSAEVARVEWDRLADKFEDYLDGKSRVIQKASSGGRTFYRLRAMGFADISDARRFCSVLVAENADCIPVTTR